MLPEQFPRHCINCCQNAFDAETGDILAALACTKHFFTLILNAGKAAVCALHD